MLKWFSPLWIFIGGSILTLIATIFFPIIFDAQAPMVADPDVIAGKYWGFKEFLTGSRLAIFLLLFGCTVWLTVKAFFAKRNG